MSRDLLTDPLWRAEGMGAPVADTPHAVSVALPTGDHVVRYEECDPAVLDAMRSGYPRFFVNRIVRELNAVASGRFATAGELAVIFPNGAAARRCLEFLEGAGRRWCATRSWNRTRSSNWRADRCVAARGS